MFINLTNTNESDTYKQHLCFLMEWESLSHNLKTLHDNKQWRYCENQKHFIDHHNTQVIASEQATPCIFLQFLITAKP